jgi:uncharacterized membrane protein
VKPTQVALILKLSLVEQVEEARAVVVLVVAVPPVAVLPTPIVLSALGLLLAHALLTVVAVLKPALVPLQHSHQALAQHVHQQANHKVATQLHAVVQLVNESCSMTLFTTSPTGHGLLNIR